MSWILSKIRVVNIGLFLCVLAPCFVFASSAAEESPEAVIQLFYKALREGKYTEAHKYFARSTVELIKEMERDKAWSGLFWVDLLENHTKYRTIQTVEVVEVTPIDHDVYGVRKRDIMCSVLASFADGSIQKLKILLTQEGGSWRLNGIGTLNEEEDFQDYVVSIYSWDLISSFLTYSSYFEILKDGHRVYMSRLDMGGVSLYHYNKAISLGKDITGNGTPNLVVSEYTGGAHCCYVDYVFEMGQEVRQIAKIWGGSRSVDFTDLDGDSKLEIVLRDWSFAYFLTYFAAYRPPDVILRYQDGAYRIAADLMRKPAPSQEDLERDAVQVLDDASWEGEAWLEHGWVPESLWSTMLELLYTGHSDLAWQFFEMAWPPDISGKDAWLSKFRAKLEDSPYWPFNSKRAYFVS